MKKVDFSVLYYSPSFVSGERINLGMLVYCSEDDKIKFEHIQKRDYSRLHAFDDELNTDIVTAILETISKDIDDIQSEKNMPLIKNKRTFNLKDYIRYYANEFKFTSINTVEYESFDDAVTELKQVHFRLYYPKEKRPSKNIEHKFIERLIQSKNSNYVKEKRMSDAFGLDIKYDFLIDNSIGVKFFNITKDNTKVIVNSIRTWAWNCQNGSVNKTVIVYQNNVCPNEKESDMVIKSIKLIKSTTDYVVSIDEFANLISDLKTANA